MKKLLFCFLVLFSIASYAQSFIHIDVGNSIMLRPNLGYEYHWKNMALGGNLRWQRNAHIWVSEFPGFMKTKGANVDLTLKYFYKKFVFTETGLRATIFEAPFFVSGWHDHSLYNSDKKIEPFVKIGLISNRNKKFQIDLGVGTGIVLSTKNLFIGEGDQYDEKFIPLTNDQLKAKFKKPSGIESIWVPHAQMRIYRRIGN